MQEILIYNDKEWPRLTNYNCSQKQGLLDMQYQINLTESNNTAECDRIDPKSNTLINTIFINFDYLLSFSQLTSNGSPSRQINEHHLRIIHINVR